MEKRDTYVLDPSWLDEEAFRRRDRKPYIHEKEVLCDPFVLPRTICRIDLTIQIYQQVN